MLGERELKKENSCEQYLHKPLQKSSMVKQICFLCSCRTIDQLTFGITHIQTCLYWQCICVFIVIIMIRMHIECRRGGGGGQMSIQGCAADMDKVFSKFDTFMGHKFAYFHQVYQFGYIDGLQITYFCWISVIVVYWWITNIMPIFDRIWSGIVYGPIWKSPVAHPYPIPEWVPPPPPPPDQMEA